MKKNRLDIRAFVFYAWAIILGQGYFFVYAQSEKPSTSVELNGDTVEYSLDGNRVTAKGNVVVKYQDSVLTCDQIEFLRDTSTGYATGHVRLKTPQGEITGDNMTYNFQERTGEFNGARIFSSPLFGTGPKITKVDDKKMVVQNGYMTTCDLDKPHFHLVSKKLDVYPTDKIVGRGVKFVLGKVPLMYFPRFTQKLRDKPVFTFTPGFDKEWGIFVLTQYRFLTTEKLKATLRLDLRERKDIAEGLDLKYTTDHLGSGIAKIYYMNERAITSTRFYEERPSPTPEHERFKAEWRHKWNIAPGTEAILQYYKLSDSTFLKDYFKREYEKDRSPKTFFLLTSNTQAGTVSFNTEARVNRFESSTERLPEIKYDLPSIQIADTGLFFKNATSFANLSSKDATPTEVHRETMRVDIDNEISYPMKVYFIEFTPFIGGRQTYYSKTKDISRYNVLRGLFRTGAELSTKFYKVFDVGSDWLGLNIHRLRHIITPRVTYNFSPEPTIPSSLLDVYDSSIDSLDRTHNLNFAIENKLQTKRNNQSVDLLRLILSTDFRLKEHPGQGGFDILKSEADFIPTDWLSLYFDSEYDTRNDRLSTANFDFYINGKDGKWSLGVGKRLNVAADDQITTELSYTINPKWALRFYERIDVKNGILKEQEYTIRRDLHEWFMDINFNETRTQGSEIWIVFTLKAFPDLTLDFGSSFNRRKTGSQSSEGEE